MDRATDAVAADSCMHLNRLKKLRQLWSESPSVVLRSGHSRRCPECLQSRALEREVARRISACGCYAGVPQLIAYGHQIHPGLEHRDCAGMSQEVRPYSGGKSRVGLMKCCRMLAENMMDAVPSESLAAKVPEHWAIGIDSGGSRQRLDCGHRFRPQRRYAFLFPLAAQMRGRAWKQVPSMDPSCLTDSGARVIEKENQRVIASADGGAAVRMA